MPHQPVLAPLVDRDSRMCLNKLGIIGRQAQMMLNVCFNRGPDAGDGEGVLTEKRCG